MFDGILVAVDGSGPSLRAAEAGLDLADACGAGVDVVCAVPAAAPEGEGAHERAQTAVRAVAVLAEERGLAVETHVLTGRPARAVVDHADRTGSDLVVMGREGRSGVAERILGSTTERVLRATDVPVLVVPAGEHPPPTAYERVLVTTDGSEAAERAGPYAVEVADRFGARLDVLSVVDVQAAGGVFDAGGLSKEFVQRLEDRAREATERIAAGDDAEGVEVHRTTVRGRPHEGIADYAAEEGTDLVVMASAGQTGLAGQHLGSVAGRVLRVVGVPVLVVGA